MTEAATPAPEAPRRSMGKSAALMAVGTMLSRLTGFGRTLALVYVLGLKDLGDAYSGANTVPNIVFELVVGGVLSASIVPVFTRVFTTEDEDDAWRAVSAICTIIVVALTAVTLIVLAFAPWIIDLYTTKSNEISLADKRDIATTLLRFFVPQLAIYGFISVATGLLHAKRQFAAPMFAPIANNLVVIGLLLGMRWGTDHLTAQGLIGNTTALAVLGLGTTAGVCAMGVVLLPYLRRVGGSSIKWRWEPKNPAVSTLLKMSGWTFGFVVVNQVALLVTMVLAGRTSGGVVAFLSTYTFFILPHGILSVSVMSALQPDLAEKWARSEVEGFRKQFAYGLRIILVMMVPSAVGYALLASPIVDLVLAHGAGDSADTKLVKDALLWMTLGLPGFSGFLFAIRAFQAMHRARTVFYLYLLENGVNVLTAPLLYAQFGFKGLATSITLAYAIAAVFSLVKLAGDCEGIEGRQLTSTLVRTTLSTAAMSVPVVAFRSLDSLPLLLRVAAAVSFGFVVFAVSAKILKIEELRFIVRAKRRRTEAK